MLFTLEPSFSFLFRAERAEKARELDYLSVAGWFVPVRHRRCATPFLAQQHMHFMNVTLVAPLLCKLSCAGWV